MKREETMLDGRLAVPVARESVTFIFVIVGILLAIAAVLVASGR